MSKFDSVDKPAHYNAYEIEAIDAIRWSMSPEEFKGHCKGTAIAYILRADLKNGVEDYRKARWYLSWLCGDDPRETRTAAPVEPPSTWDAFVSSVEEFPPLKPITDVLEDARRADFLRRVSGE